MLHLLTWSADFWLGSVPHHFRSCRNTWQLMGSNLAPSLLVLPRLARHNSSLTVWQPCPSPPRLQLDPLETGIQLWRGLQDKGAPRWSGRQQFSYCFCCTNFFIMPMVKADHQVQIQKEIPIVGIWPLLLKQLATSLGCTSNASFATWPWSLLPLSLLPLASGEAIEQNGNGAASPQLP